jgi:hypothetical protein
MWLILVKMPLKKSKNKANGSAIPFASFAILNERYQRINFTKSGREITLISF